MGCRTIFSWAKTVETKRIAYKENVHRRAPSSTFLAARKFRGARFWQKFARRRTFWVKLSRDLFMFAPRRTSWGAFWRASPAIVLQENVRRQIVHATPVIMTFRKAVRQDIGAPRNCGPTKRAPRHGVAQYCTSTNRHTNVQKNIMHQLCL